MNASIRPRRLFVSGGGDLSANAALFWRELGGILARERGLIVITGGLLARQYAPESLTADRMIVDGMRPVLQAAGVPAMERIETFLPDPLYDKSELKRFSEGVVRVLQKRNPQARRFSMVQTADVVICIEGERGTRSVIDVAQAIERPFLPLPFGKQDEANSSLRAWRAQREEIKQWFRMSESEARSFEDVQLDQCSEAEIGELAVRVHQCLMRGFTQGCFVIMPFNAECEPVFKDAIEPALASRGYQPWRTDISVPAGDVVTAIRDGINHCYFAIADTTGDRPNVMYELGLAHASRKDVILLRKLNPDGSMPNPPFDFHNHKLLGYTNDMEALRRDIEAAIVGVSGRTRGFDGI